VSVDADADAGAGATLEPGELTVVPAGTTYRLNATQLSVALTLARANRPAA